MGHLSVVTDQPTPPMTAEAPSSGELEALSDDEVELQVRTWAGRVAAGEARLLLYLGEFDERKAWSGTGILSCAHWVSWRLGMGLKAAYERVRVARALRQLPATRAAFLAGELSFTQVRAITRMACAADEEKYVRLARCATGSQIETLARGIRRARRLADREPDSEGGPWLRVSYDEDGDLRFSGKLSAEDGALLLAALEAVRTDLDATATATDSSAEDSSAGKPAAEASATRGDALLGLCRSYLTQRGRSQPERSRRERSRLVAQVDPLSG